MDINRVRLRKQGHRLLCRLWEVRPAEEEEVAVTLDRARQGVGTREAEEDVTVLARPCTHQLGTTEVDLLRSLASATIVTGPTGASTTTAGATGATTAATQTSATTDHASEISHQ